MALGGRSNRWGWDQEAPLLGKKRKPSGFACFCPRGSGSASVWWIAGVAHAEAMQAGEI